MRLYSVQYVDQDVRIILDFAADERDQAEMKLKLRQEVSLKPEPL